MKNLENHLFSVKLTSASSFKKKTTSRIILFVIFWYQRQTRKSKSFNNWRLLNFVLELFFLSNCNEFSQNFFTDWFIQLSFSIGFQYLFSFTSWAFILSRKSFNFWNLTPQLKQSSLFPHQDWRMILAGNPNLCVSYFPAQLPRSPVDTASRMVRVKEIASIALLYLSHFVESSVEHVSRFLGPRNITK